MTYGIAFIISGLLHGWIAAIWSGSGLANVLIKTVFVLAAVGSAVLAAGALGVSP